MDILLIPFLELLRTVLWLYSWVIIIGVALSWLVVFRIINPYQPLVQHISHFYSAVTEPVFRPIRRVIPMVHGIDLTPLLVLMGISFLNMMIARILLRFIGF